MSREAVAAFEDYVRENTLAKEVEYGPLLARGHEFFSGDSNKNIRQFESIAPRPMKKFNAKIEGKEVTIWLEKAAP